YAGRKIGAPAPPPPALPRCLTRSGNTSPGSPVQSPGRHGLDRFGEHRNCLALMAGPRETDDAVDQREQGMVAPHANVGPRKDRGAALAEQDRAGVDRLAGPRLHPEPLPDTVASVA